MSNYSIEDQLDKEISELLYLINQLVGGLESARLRNHKELLTNKEFHELKKNTYQQINNAIYKQVTQYIAKENKLARIAEVSAIRKQFHSRRFGISEFMNERIKQLENKTNEE